MKNTILALAAFLSTSPLLAAEKPAYEMNQAMVFSIRNDGGTSHPWIRTFPGGKSKDGRDLSEDLNFLKKHGRGKSELYPAEDAKPGLIVIFRSLAFYPSRKDPKKYDVLFEGEYNAVSFEISSDLVRDLIDGKTIDLKIRSVNKGGAWTVYTITSDMDLKLSLDGKDLIVHRVAGDAQLSKVTRISKTPEDFQSAQVVEEKPKDQEFLYRGTPGKLKGLNIINMKD